MDRAAAFEDLAQVMDALLAPNGCPWDKEQTPESVRPYILEEAFETVDAIDRGDYTLLKEELGDLLFQVVFVSAMAQRLGHFSLEDVCEGVASKMRRRHPWVFDDAEQKGDAAAALAGWEAMKRREKASRGALDGVPANLPALLRALRVGEKMAAVGYDWPDASGPRAKIDEELAELDAIENADQREAELGDLLFSVANLARKEGIDPEGALRATLNRVGQRFGVAEKMARDAGHSLRDLDDAERDRLWEDAKKTQI